MYLFLLLRMSCFAALKSVCEGCRESNATAAEVAVVLLVTASDTAVAVSVL